MFQFVFWRSCKGCGLGEPAGSRVLFLREQVRDMRVQEFLRELIIGVAAPSDLAGSILVEILHYGEGGDVEQVARILKQISRVCDCLVSFSHLCLYLACSYCLHLYTLYIYLSSIDVCVCLCVCVCMGLLYLSRR